MKHVKIYEETDTTGWTPSWGHMLDNPIEAEFCDNLFELTSEFSDDISDERMLELFNKVIKMKR
jgi:hypothetical protein